MSPVPVPAPELAPGERVLLYIYFHFTSTAVPPSTRDISEAVGLNSNSAISRHLEKLRELGWVRWIPGENGTLTLTETGANKARWIEHMRVKGPQS